MSVGVTTIITVLGSMVKSQSILAVALFLLLAMQMAPVCIGQNYFVSTLAGDLSGNYGTSDGSGTNAKFSFPQGIIYNAVDGKLYLADHNNNEIRIITTAGSVTTLAGRNPCSTLTDGTGTNACFNFLVGITVDTTGLLYVSDSLNNAVRKVTLAGVVSTFVTGFNHPASITIDSSGNLYLADTANNRICKITSSGAVTTLAGSQTFASGYVDATGTNAKFNQPWGVALNTAGSNLYTTELNNQAVRVIQLSTGAVTTLIAYAFSSAHGLTFYNGNLLVCDYGNFVICGVNIVSGAVTIFAGIGSYASNDNCYATAAGFASVGALTVDSSNVIYASDVGGCRVRKITPLFPTSHPTSRPSQFVVDIPAIHFTFDNSIANTGYDTTVISTVGTPTFSATYTRPGYGHSVYFNNPSASSTMSSNYYEVTVNGLNCPMSIAVWLRSDLSYSMAAFGLHATSSPTSAQGIVMNMSSSSAQAYLALPAWLDLTFGIIPANSWVHLAITVDRYFAATAYLNGVITSFAQGTASFVGHKSLVIGGAADHSKGFNGYMQDLRYYNYSLSPAHVLQLTDYLVPTSQPSSRPSRRPSSQPSRQPITQPSQQPSRHPSAQPTSQPFCVPTSQPSRQPTSAPSAPTGQPSRQPISRPSSLPSSQPSKQPMNHPTGQPTSQPTQQPTSRPSVCPTSQPSSPTSQPTTQPNSKPTSLPSNQPVSKPSRQPTSHPSRVPSIQPTTQPSMQPSLQPSARPTSSPSSRPSSAPSVNIAGCVGPNSVYTITNAFALVVLRTGGEVVAWGDAGNGGNVTTALQSALSVDVASITASRSGFAALSTDGTVRAWGHALPASPTALASNVLSLTATENAFACLHADGSVTAFGSRQSGGAATAAACLTSDTAVVQYLTGVTAIAATDSSFAAVRSDGHVVTWGNSLTGGGHSSFTTKPALINIQALSANKGAFTALSSGRQVQVIGANSYGFNITSSQLASGVEAVFSGVNSFAVLRNTGTMFVWNQVASNSKKLTRSFKSAKCYAATAKAAAVLHLNGTVSSWTLRSSGAATVSMPSNLTQVQQIFHNDFAFAALTTSGAVYTWGGSDSGGNSSSVQSLLTSGVVSIFSTSSAFAALKSTGAVVTWGSAAHGGDSSSEATFLSSGVSQICCNDVACVAVKTTDGSAASWGLGCCGGDSSAVASKLRSNVISCV